MKTLLRSCSKKIRVGDDIMFFLFFDCDEDSNPIDPDSSNRNHHSDLTFENIKRLGDRMPEDLHTPEKRIKQIVREH